MSEAVERYEGRGGVVNFEDYAMGVEALVRQVALIQNVMERVMKENEHYGKIPGTNKPTLLKPGAEKLCMVFRLEPDYEIIREFREDLFIAYTVKCNLRHIPTGQSIASGVGSCNSREGKYRYRYIETSTGKPLPREYWKAKDEGNSKEMKRLLGGDGFRAAKVDGAWMICTSQQIDNDNPWDLDNTIMKMACKRALVAATLNATAASDIFTQDLEDMPDGTAGQDKQSPQQQKPEGQKAEKPPIQEPGSKIKDPNAPVSEGQKKAIFAMLSKLGIKDDIRHAYLADILNLGKPLDSQDSLNMGEASTIINTLQQRLDEKAQG